MLLFNNKIAIEGNDLSDHEALDIILKSVEEIGLQSFG
jgi:hypothetical protein